MDAQPHADQRVRLAMPKEAAAIASVQVVAWRVAYAGRLPAEVLDRLDANSFTAAWHTGIVRPAEARSRVLVALQGDDVVGFAATTMSDDPDAEAGTDGLIAEFCVRPDQRGAGHGSRLLNAAADTLTTDGFRRGTMWVDAGDDDLRQFLAEAGWEPDGAHRELDLRGDGEVRVKQVRLHTALGDPAADPE